jgi:hypothetical protein
MATTRSLWSRWHPLTLFVSAKSRSWRSESAAPNLDRMRCRLCRTVIAPTSFGRVVDEGKNYHASCWEQNVRQAVEQRKSA